MRTVAVTVLLITGKSHPICRIFGGSWMVAHVAKCGVYDRAGWWRLGHEAFWGAFKRNRCWEAVEVGLSLRTSEPHIERPYSLLFALFMGIDG